MNAERYAEIKKSVDYDVAGLGQKNITDILDEYNSEVIELAALIMTPIGQKILRGILMTEAIETVAKNKLKEDLTARTEYSSDGEVVATLKAPKQAYAMTDDDVKNIAKICPQALRLVKSRLDKDGKQYAKDNLKLVDDGSWTASVMMNEDYVKQLEILKKIAEVDTDD